MTITYGIIGSGMLGQAMAQGALTGGVAGSSLWMANRSGQPVALEGGAGVSFTADPQKLAEACDVILLCVPPAAMPALKIDASDKLVLSVVAGLTLAGISQASGSARVIRAMSSPAAAQCLAYTPWVVSETVTEADRAATRAFFGAMGQTDEIADEAHIDHFTAMTGPVPGFVAYFADSMIRHATAQGIAPEVAERAIRQLFLASGEMMKEGASPAAQVQEMIDYAGTTAAGLIALGDSDFDAALSAALTAAADRAREI